MATLNGRQLIHPSALSGTTTSKIVGGFGIDVQTYQNGDTIISTLVTQHAVTKIIGGPGIIVHDNGNGEIHIQTAMPPSTYTKPTSKPIFMVGLPSTCAPNQFDKILRRLENKLSDYHVLVLRNTTDTYTAKLFSERDGDTLPITDIKKYINQKMK